MKNILKLNPISNIASKALGSNYALVNECSSPDAIILRSFNMHDYTIAPSTLCIGRAGAGVNNIPVDSCTSQGIVVFNTPGANANAVKELVIASIILSSRKIYDGVAWAASLQGDDVAKQVEAGKNKFVGPEILGKKLGVIGLGAIGALVANCAVELGMTVIGYDPYISIEQAWGLNNNVLHENDIKKLFSECDYITIHVPLLPSTKALINSTSLKFVKKGCAIINCSRGELVDDDSIINAVASGHISRYVTDFPNAKLLNIPNIITIPHLGASTPEAEDNCAVMATKQIVDYLENGNITNSVNFPNCKLARTSKCRITILHKNVKNVLSSITDKISKATLNISNMLSQAQGNYAYAILDLDEAVSLATIKQIESISDIIRIRIIK